MLKEHVAHGWLYRTVERGFNAVCRLRKGPDRVLRHSFITLMVLLATIALNFYLYVKVPKGFSRSRKRRLAARSSPTSPLHSSP